MIRVLVVDDSKLVREVLRTTLSAQPDIEVVATASNPYEARREIVRLKPDVMTLDLEMPRMGGLTFLRKLMKSFPMPVVVLSAFTEEGSDVALAALEVGAIDVVRKASSPAALEEQTHALAARIRTAATSHVCAPSAPAKVVGGWSGAEPGRLVVLGASTGGTQALVELLSRLPARMPPVAIVQHMPELFTTPFAARLNDVSLLAVREAADGEPLESGVVYVAPGGRHLEVTGTAARPVARVYGGARVHHCIPSVDVLFHSAARIVGRGVVAVLLTGMGADGADGMLALRQAGATTIAQDEQTSVVWGMPGRAVELGAVESIVSLENIPLAVLGALRTRTAEV